MWLRAGAIMHVQVASGEWWRLVSGLFVHAGPVHLIANVVGLYLLARFAEDAFGTIRTIAIFAFSGISASVASYLMAPGPSVGCSGAVLGLLGALIVELALYRDRHRQMRPIWGVALLAAVAQLALGFLSTEIDQWAHGVGLVAGGVIGLAISPSTPWRKLGSWLALALAVAGGIAVGCAFTGVARTSAAESLGAGTHKTWEIGGATVSAPAAWSINDGELVDGELFVVLALSRDLSPDAVAAHWKSEPDRARSRSFDQVEVATESLVPLPPGWEPGGELDVSYEDPLGERAHYRVVVAAKRVDGSTILASLYMPDSLAHNAPQFFTDLLGSVR